MGEKERTVISEYKEILARAKGRHPQVLKALVNLKKKTIKGFDQKVALFHSEVFQKIDCTKCANCCATLGPRLTHSDIARLSGHLGVSQGDFVTTHLKTDEDSDQVFKCLPCPFLAGNLLCSLYEARPRACRDYPHTLENRVQNRLSQLATNTLYCPAAYLIAERILKEWSKQS